MTAAAHATVTADTRVDVLSDGRVRLSEPGWSLTVECQTAAQAHRLAAAFDEARDMRAQERGRRLASVDAVVGAGA